MVSQGSLFSAKRITNLQFLRICQRVREDIQHNIANTWRGAGLIPFDPKKVLIRIKFQKVPEGIINRPVTALEVQVEIKKAIDTLTAVCPTPLKPQVSLLKRISIQAIAKLSLTNKVNQ